MDKEYKTYLNGSTPEHKEIQNSIYGKIELSEESIEKIRAIKKKIKLILFAEVYCPDCRVFVPFIEKIRRENKNIEIEIKKRSGMEKEAEKEYGVTRIPTLLRPTASGYIKIYEEFPEIVMEKLKKNGAGNTIQLIQEYRIGRYNKDIEKQIVERIIEIG